MFLLSVGKILLKSIKSYFLLMQEESVILALNCSSAILHIINSALESPVLGVLDGFFASLSMIIVSEVVFYF